MAAGSPAGDAQAVAPSAPDMEDDAVRVEEENRGPIVASGSKHATHHRVGGAHERTRVPRDREPRDDGGVRAKARLRRSPPGVDDLRTHAVRHDPGLEEVIARRREATLLLVVHTQPPRSTGTRQRNAGVPVIACPRTSVCTSSVPS